ncbi:1,4-alpha-glucan branching protein GlgB [Luteimonas sp. RC10]|uniref:1,4-alpha-glucan branching protein GlgB n=1 Tax=Luteimonas sp. RC10 TaxID=2587035 RepID=UPI00160D0D46|nr:1,4-alpha-glucan branching protein GlgB [Luteimonas sp. RC10]MBB3345298.1 1,4-alpha-glucan branching enzyme [Luteimonas sp. RC10]
MSESASAGHPPAHASDELGPEVDALLEACAADAFALLGPHVEADGDMTVRALLPGAHGAALVDATGAVLVPMHARDPRGLFEARLAPGTGYCLRIEWPNAVQITEDPYRFGPVLEEATLYALRDGDPDATRRALGAHARTLDGVSGTGFAVWAPNAQRVALVGDFNAWDERRHPMRLRHTAGVWELFLPQDLAGQRYKFAIVTGDGRRLAHKADPLARQAELPPATASIVPQHGPFAWTDQAWMAERGARADLPMSIYEVHAASWQRTSDGASLDWDALAAQLVPYVAGLGFTHVELLPVGEYPFGGSWGYQPTGLYAPTARHGGPDGFARFVDACHRAGLGVIVDWVGAHFPDDAHGLQGFDGTALYEHADPREGLHRDWNTLIYNYGRNEVSGYLIGCALEWIERFHLDGLRIDAVASMLYRDYSRGDGEWVPNEHGGRENLQAVAFLRRLNTEVAARHPGVWVMAEESTAWHGVTAPVDEGGLGFSHKWNMGWMHDTLQYMQRDPVHRRHHHSEMTFGMVYAFSERFVLPLSHDEVVHGKGALLSKMPGDDWRQRANLRAYFGFMWAHPGRKLLFMGGEFGQRREWAHDGALDWHLLDDPGHAGIQRLVGDLNALLRAHAALHVADDRPEGFDWSVGDDHANSVFAFLRHRPGGGRPVLVVSNMTPEVHHGYRVGVPHAGRWREILNTDSAHYGGSNVGNGGNVVTAPESMHGHAQSLRLTLPPLATIWLECLG